LIKVFAAFTVVFLHSAAPILYQYGKIDAVYWQYGNIYDSAVRMCVPLFFMVGGALLLNANSEPLKIFFKKRFLKVVIPLVVWTIIYVLFNKYILNQDINVFKQIIAGLMFKQYYHLWFLYTIIGLYLFVPFLKIIIHNSPKEMHVYFVVLWLLAVTIIPFINKFSGYSKIPNYMPMMAGYVGYFVLGYLLSKLQVSKKHVYLSVALASLSTMITINGTDYLTHQQNKFDDWFYGYMSVSTFTQAVSYFILLKYLGESSCWKNRKLQTTTIILSSASLGIYLIHPIMLEILMRVGLDVLNGDSTLIMVPLVATLAFFMSFLTVYLMQKIPILKKIVP